MQCYALDEQHDFMWPLSSSSFEIYYSHYVIHSAIIRENIFGLLLLIKTSSPFQMVHLLNDVKLIFTFFEKPKKNRHLFHWMEFLCSSVGFSVLFLFFGIFVYFCIHLYCFALNLQF